MDEINPTNLTAQLNYRARGNPPGTLPVTAIGNCYPGLEFDLRNAWTTILMDIELHETRNVVRRVESNPSVRGLKNAILLSITTAAGEAIPLTFDPQQDPRIRAVERGNALVDLVQLGGQMVDCRFLRRPLVSDVSSFFQQPGNDLVGEFVADGDLGSPWVSELKSADGPEHVVLDFGADIEMLEIRIFPGRDLIFTLFPRDFLIEVSSDGTNWTSQVDESDFSPPEGEFAVFPLTPVTARFVRFTARAMRPFNGQFLCAVSEIEIDVPEVAVDLEVRQLFPTSGENTIPVLDEGVGEPGHLTQSLCSPWQHDYRDCGCFYWAASRPDYVNVDANTGQGHNWMDTTRQTGPTGEPQYGDRNITYEDMYRSWESKQTLKFQIGGIDED